MNNGNLLNSLLSATSNNVAPNKNVVAKSREETSEKFRDALQQVRPDVAAAKPRKPAPEAAPKPEQTRARDDVEPPAKAKPARQAEKTTAKNAPAEKADARNDKDQEPRVTADDTLVSKHKETECADDKSAVASTEKQEPTDDPASDVIIDGVGNAALMSELMQPAASIDPLAMPTTEMAAEGLTSDAEVLSDPGALNPLLASGDADPALTAHVGQAGLVINNGGELPVIDTEADIDADALLTPGALTVSNTLAEQRTNTALAAATTNGLSAAIEQLATASADTVDSEIPAESSGDQVDAAENPDFFTLLNAKTGISKAADAPASIDKMIQVDSTKPAVAATPLAEPLARLTEAQSPAARSFVVQTGVPVTVGQPQWSQAVGEKVLWLAAQNVSAAEIRLDPPDLGQLHVKVSVNQDQASVTFTSPHPMVREALDQQLSRLREMFSEQGLNLVNVDVSDRSAAQQQQDQERSGHSAAANDTEEEELAPVGVTQITNLRLVDHYA